MARDYKEEYRRDHASPEDIRNRSLRNQARRKLEKEGRVRKGDGKEVDHKKPLSKGGAGLAKSNLRVVSRHTNRVKGAGRSR